MSWTLRFHVVVCLMAGLAVGSMEGSAQLVVSEASAGGGDWIEVRNDGSDAVNLDGHHLLDNLDDESGWTFGPVVLGGGDRLVVLANGEDQPVWGGSWEFPVIDSDVFSYTMSTTNPDVSWKNVGFDDGSWQSGPGGFGYGDGDDATVVPNDGTLYLRIAFDVETPEDWAEMGWAMDYDDGYIAYLNGEEIQRSSNLVGSAGNAWDYTDGYVEAVLFNGGIPDMTTWALDSPGSPQLLPGQNVLAIQVHNANATSSDLTARPFLGLRKDWGGPTMFSAAPTWWPQAEYDNLQATFQLSPGEHAVLRDPDGQLLDALILHPDLPDAFSVGRPEGSSTEWCIFDQPTPGEPNVDAPCYSGILPSPQLTVPSGFYDEAQTVQLASAIPNAQVRYTLDGSVPGPNSQEFPDDGLTAYTTTVLSVKAFSTFSNMLPSGTQDESYFIDALDHELPVISVMIAPDDLFDWNDGMYELGPNASDDYPFFGANFWQPWSRHARMQGFDALGALAAREELDLEIHGGWSRAEPQKSFRFDFKGVHTGDLDWPLFPEEPWLTQLNNINVRNGGQHVWATKIQDALISDVAAQTHAHSSAWQPVELYLNGDYWGLYGAREKSDEHYVAAHFGTSPEEVTLLNPLGALAGDASEFTSACNALLAGSPSSPAFYNTFAETFDAESYMDYFILQTFFQNMDWMGIAWGLNNTKVFKASPEHTWRYILYDTDACLGHFGQSVWENYLEYARNPSSPSVHSNLFDHVLGNPTFRHRFVNRYADLVNTLLQSDAFIERMGSLTSQIEGTMPQHIARWGAPAGMDAWDNAVNNMMLRESERVTTSRIHLMESFNLPFQRTVTLNATPNWAGDIRVNTIVPGPYPWDGVYFNSCPIEMEAIADPGYMFTHWSDNDHSAGGQFNPLDQTIEVDVSSNDTFWAHFSPCPTDATASVLNAGEWLGVETENVPYIDSVSWHLDGAYLGTTPHIWFHESTGEYSAVVHFDGCAVASEELLVMDVGEPTKDLELSCHPNPVSTHVTMNCPHDEAHIHNALGELVHHVPRGQTVISTADWPAGTYTASSGKSRISFVVTH